MLFTYRNDAFLCIFVNKYLRLSHSFEDSLFALFGSGSSYQTIDLRLRALNENLFQ